MKWHGVYKSHPVCWLWIYDQHFRRILRHPFLPCAVDKIESGANTSGYYVSENFRRTWQMWIEEGSVNPKYSWVIPKIRVASMED